jgi:hypothetical protein
MSRIREVVARMAVDPVFAEQVRSHPEEVAQAYGLSPDEIDKLRGLAAADAQSGPAPLGARLSKSGITGGVLAGFLAGAADPTASAEGGDISKAEFVVFDPQPDPPGGPHVAEAALGGPDTTPPDTQPADGSDDGGIIIDWTPDSDAFDYGIPDTQPESADVEGQEIAITKVSDAAGTGEMAIIDDGKASADVQSSPMITSDGDKIVKLPIPTLTADSGEDTNIF